MERSSGPDLATRGRLAKETGCNIETIRYYENIGLMPAPQRSGSGYRLYDEGARRRLRFILRGRELGFSVEELRSLLRLVDGGDYSCGEVHDLTVEHLQSVRAKISDLRRLERTLTNMAAQCEGGAVPECPVIDALFGAPLPGRSSQRPCRRLGAPAGPEGCGAPGALR